MRCFLCSTHLEDHEHLFFRCNISAVVWSSVQNKCGICIPQASWVDTISWIARNWITNNLTTLSWKLCFTITVYSLWIERNTRLHQNRANGVQFISEKIIDMVRMKLSSLKDVYDSNENRRQQPDGTSLTRSLLGSLLCGEGLVSVSSVCRTC